MFRPKDGVMPPPTHWWFSIVVSLVGGQEYRFRRRVDVQPDESAPRQIREKELARVDEHRKQARENFAAAWVEFEDAKTHASAAYHADQIAGILVERLTDNLLMGD